MGPGGFVCSLYCGVTNQLEQSVVAWFPSVQNSARQSQSPASLWHIVSQRRSLWCRYMSNAAVVTISLFLIQKTPFYSTVHTIQMRKYWNDVVFFTFFVPGCKEAKLFSRVIWTQPVIFVISSCAANPFSRFTKVPLNKINLGVSVTE